MRRLKEETAKKIVALAASSSLAHREWTGRGRAPIGYVKGMAVCYGEACTALQAGDPTAKAIVAIVEGHHDVFDYYEQQMDKADMSNDGASDLDRLRHLYVILTGVGVEESSGGSDVGQDASAPGNRTSDQAEAGLFQQSWDSLEANPTELSRLLNYYSAHADEGYRDIFAEGVTLRHDAMISYGSGDGLKFQQLAKTCPRFATECAAVCLRTLYTHFGTVIHRTAELAPEADALFKQVQDVVLAPGAAVVGPPAPKPMGGFLEAILALLKRLFGPPKPAPAPPVPAAGPLAWLKIAIREVGFHETGVNRGTDKYVQGGRTGGEVGEPWCADFANYCFETVGIRGTRSAMARSFEHSPDFVKLDGPAIGAVVTLWRGSPASGSGHVFFYLGHVDDHHVLGLGGNQSDSVCRQPEPTDRLVGYYWPKSQPLPRTGRVNVASGDNMQGGSET